MVESVLNKLQVIPVVQELLAFSQTRVRELFRKAHLFTKVVQKLPEVEKVKMPCLLL